MSENKMNSGGAETTAGPGILIWTPASSKDSKSSGSNGRDLDRDLLELDSPHTVTSKSRGASSKPHALLDYGWRFHGRPVRVLEDRSSTLQATDRQAAAALLSRYCADGASLTSCLQCGACTASCNLAEEGSLFPRRQMTLLQLGQKDSLVADPNIWLCFNCVDCSSGCPANARPGRIMAAIRQMAVEHYSAPRFLGRFVNHRKGLAWVTLVAVLTLLAAMAVGGSFAPQVSPVHYASMLPHLTLNLLFCAAAGFSAISAAIGASRAWKAFAGEPLWKADLRHLSRAVRAATREILAHRNFSECQQFPLSRWAHGSMFYGFLTLFLLAGVAATSMWAGVLYPFRVLHPLKIAGNVAAVLMIFGNVYFLYQRWRASRSGDASSWFDWTLLLNLLLVTVSGMLVEIFRYANIAALAYPTYFLHLVCAFVLLAGLAHSKLAHVVYRTLALTARQYEALSERARTHSETHLETRGMAA
jgi:quinone-modifying oxidoreductase subunit QmoC